MRNDYYFYRSHYKWIKEQEKRLINKFSSEIQSKKYDWERNPDDKCDCEKAVNIRLKWD